MTDSRNTDPLVAGVKKAFLHFSKAAIEVASGVRDIVDGVSETVRPGNGDDEPESGGPQKIDIE